MDSDGGDDIFSLLFYVMNRMSRASIGIILGIASLLASCATLGKTGQAMRKGGSAAAAKLGALARAPKLPRLAGTPLARLMPAPGVKVVDVREKDLRELPTGQERALAYRNERKNGFWIFGGPVDFQEPSLPEPGSEPDGSLLPPRMP